jgi:hypothetical protein
MNREDATALLTMVQLDRAPPPPIEPEKMAALFVTVISDDAPDGLSAIQRCAWRAGGQSRGMEPAAKPVRVPVCGREARRD